MKPLTKKPKERKLTFAQREEIIKLHIENGISQRELALRYGVSRITINRHCRMRAPSPTYRSSLISTEKMVHMFLKEHKSLNRIAEELGIARRSVVDRFKAESIDYKPKLKRKLFEKTIPHYKMRMKIWEAKIIERDNMMCKQCGRENEHKNRLEAHHIVPVRFVEDEKDLFSMDNGITLCNSCHMKIHYREMDFVDIFRNLIKTTGSV